MAPKSGRPAASRDSIRTVSPNFINPVFIAPWSRSSITRRSLMAVHISILEFELELDPQRVAIDADQISAPGRFPLPGRHHVLQFHQQIEHAEIPGRHGREVAFAGIGESSHIGRVAFHSPEKPQIGPIAGACPDIPHKLLSSRTSPSQGETGEAKQLIEVERLGEVRGEADLAGARDVLFTTEAGQCDGRNVQIARLGFAKVL